MVVLPNAVPHPSTEQLNGSGGAAMAAALWRFGVTAKGSNRGRLRVREFGDSSASVVCGRGWDAGVVRTTRGSGGCCGAEWSWLEDGVGVLDGAGGCWMEGAGCTVLDGAGYNN